VRGTHVLGALKGCLQAQRRSKSGSHWALSFLGKRIANSARKDSNERGSKLGKWPKAVGSL